MPVTLYSDSVRFQQVLSEERPRLVRLCRYWIGDADAAEDVAQEALLVAWQQVEGLRDLAALRSWLSGIARNMSLRWLRRHGREMARRVVPVDDRDPAMDLPAMADLDEELERADLLLLLERAMALLPKETRLTLVQKYVEDLSHREIARRSGISESNVAVRAHRGKAALRSLLAREMREEVEPFGVLTEADSWQETRLWCTNCGRQRLLGRLSEREFALSCPVCNIEPDWFHSRSAGRHSPTSGCKTFRASHNRLAAWMNDHMKRAISEGFIACVNCRQPLPLRCVMPDDAPPSVRTQRGMHFRCYACDNGTSNSLDGMVLDLPEGQAFFKAHPRIRARRQREIERDGVSALVVSFESVISHASFDVIVSRDKYETLSIFRDAPDE